MHEESVCLIVSILLSVCCGKLGPLTVDSSKDQNLLFDRKIISTVTRIN